MRLTTYDIRPLPHHIASQLAPELLDKVIDHLHSFNASLSACSLVCKSWLPASRYHLFFDINFTPKLIEFLRSSPHAMDTVVPYIRNVGLGGAWTAEQKVDFGDVISFLLQLDNIHGLFLEAWNWDLLSSTASELLLNAHGHFFQTITKLHLKYIRFPSFSLFIRFLGRFPMLEDLSFLNVTWDSDGYIAALRSPANYRESCTRPLHLKKLYIQSCFNKPILSWVFNPSLASDANQGQTMMIPPVQMLALPEILPNELTVVGTVLRSIGSSLQHVELGFLAFSADDPIFRDLTKLVDLSYNVNLKVIHIHQITLYQFPIYTPSVQNSVSLGGSTNPNASSRFPYSWLSPFLLGISSDHVRELVFVVWLSTEASLDLIDWPTLSDVLENSRISTLERLGFEVYGMGRDRAQLRSWLSARLNGWALSEAALQVRFLDG